MPERDVAKGIRSMWLSFCATPERSSRDCPPDPSTPHSPGMLVVFFWGCVLCLSRLSNAVLRRCHLLCHGLCLPLLVTEFVLVSVEMCMSASLLAWVWVLARALDWLQLRLPGDVGCCARGPALSRPRSSLPFLVFLPDRASLMSRLSDRCCRRRLREAADTLPLGA